MEVSEENRLDIATRVAYALLRQSGHLSLEEIEAIPIVLDRDEALSIEARLLQVADLREETLRDRRINNNRVIVFDPESR